MIKIDKSNIVGDIEERPRVCAIALAGPVGAGKTTALETLASMVIKTVDPELKHWSEFPIHCNEANFSMARAIVNSKAKFKILIARDFDVYLENCDEAFKLITSQDDIVNDSSRHQDALKFQRFVIHGQILAAKAIAAAIRPGWSHLVIWDRPTVDHLAFCKMFGILNDVLEEYIRLRIEAQVLHVERIYYFDVPLETTMASIMERGRSYEIGYWTKERLHKWEEIWADLARDPCMPDGCSAVVRVERTNAALHAFAFIYQYFAMTK